MKLWNDTIKQLEQWAEEHPSVLVAFSGGKDSLCVLDLCCRTFKEVAAIHYYFIPGLKVIEDQLDLCRERWGIPVLQYPRASFLDCFKYGIFCDQREEAQDWPDLELKDLYWWAQRETGINLIATGARASDGIQRRQFFENVERQAAKKDPVWQHLCWPIREWKKRDVVAYLKLHDIPLPPAAKGSVTTGVGLACDEMLWLADEHPDDWKEFTRWLPYAEAVVKRRDMFGVGA